MAMSHVKRRRPTIVAHNAKLTFSVTKPRHDVGLINEAQWCFIFLLHHELKLIMGTRPGQSNVHGHTSIRREAAAENERCPSTCFCSYSCCASDHNE